WVLLVFGGLLSAIDGWMPSWGTRLGALCGRLADRPFRWVALLVAASVIAYLPMAAVFGPAEWIHLGPFWIQAGRGLHYLVYFLAGAWLGAWGSEHGLLSREGELARRWPLWLCLAIVAFAFAVAMLLTIVSSLPQGGPGVALATLGNLSFVLTCAGW